MNDEAGIFWQYYQKPGNLFNNEIISRCIFFTVKNQSKGLRYYLFWGYSFEDFSLIFESG